MVIAKLSKVLQARFVNIDNTNRTVTNTVALPQACDYVVAAVAGAALATCFTLEAAGKLALQFTFRPLFESVDLWPDDYPNFEKTFATAQLAGKHALGVFVSLAGAFASLGGYSQWPLSVQHYLGNFDWKWMKSEAQISRAQAWTHSLEIGQRHTLMDAHVREAATTNKHERLQQIVQDCERWLGELARLHADLTTDCEKARKASSALLEGRPELPQVQNRLVDLQRDLGKIRGDHREALGSYNRSERIRIAGETTTHEKASADQLAQEINDAAEALSTHLNRALAIEVAPADVMSIAANYVGATHELRRIHDLGALYQQHCCDSSAAWESTKDDQGRTGIQPPVFTLIKADLVTTLERNLAQLNTNAKTAVQLTLEGIQRAFSALKEEVDRNLTESQQARLAEGNRIGDYLDQQGEAQQKLAGILEHLHRTFEQYRDELGRINEIGREAKLIENSDNAATAAQNSTDDSLKRLDNEADVAALYRETLNRVNELLGLLQSTVANLETLTEADLDYGVEQTTQIRDQINQKAESPLLQSDTLIEQVALVAEDAFIRMSHLKQLKLIGISLRELSEENDLKTSQDIYSFINILLKNAKMVNEIFNAQFLIKDDEKVTTIDTLFVRSEYQHFQRLRKRILGPTDVESQKQVARLPGILQDKVESYLLDAFERVSLLLQWLNEGKTFASIQQERQSEDEIINILAECVEKARIILPYSMDPTSKTYLSLTEGDSASLEYIDEISRKVFPLLLEVAHQAKSLRALKVEIDRLLEEAIRTKDATQQTAVVNRATLVLRIVNDIQNMLQGISGMVQSLQEDSEEMPAFIGKAMGAISSFKTQVEFYADPNNWRQNSAPAHPYSSPARAKPVSRRQQPSSLQEAASAPQAALGAGSASALVASPSKHLRQNSTTNMADLIEQDRQNTLLEQVGQSSIPTLAQLHAEVEDARRRKDTKAMSQLSRSIMAYSTLHGNSQASSSSASSAPALSPTPTPAPQQQQQQPQLPTPQSQSNVLPPSRPQPRSLWQLITGSGQPTEPSRQRRGFLDG